MTRADQGTSVSSYDRGPVGVTYPIFYVQNNILQVDLSVLIAVLFIIHLELLCKIIVCNKLSYTLCGDER